MADHYPRSTTGLNSEALPPGPTAAGATQVTGNASANVKGAVVEFDASTAFDVNFLEVICRAGVINVTRQQSIDIVKGAAGVETVVVPDLLTDTTSSSSGSAWGHVLLPIEIAAGTRLGARVAVNSTTNNDVFLHLVIHQAGATPGPSSYTNIGAVSADSGGTSVDPGATPDTFGAVVQLSASLAADAQILAPMFTSQANSGLSGPVIHRVNIVKGAAGVETVVVPAITVQHNFIGTTEYGIASRWRRYLTFIASGTRVGAQASSNESDATDRLIDCACLVAEAPADSGGGAEPAFVF